MRSRREALYLDGALPVVRKFAQAVLQERLDATLDPAKGFPPVEVRARAALIVLAMLVATDDEARNNAYLASYLTDEPNIGLAVSINGIRATFGLEATGW